MPQQTIGTRFNHHAACTSLLIVIAGHKTSVSLENAFWSGLKEIAQSRHMTLSNMVCDIDSRRQEGNLSSAIRLFVLDNLRNKPSRYVIDRVIEDIIRNNGKAHI